MAASRNGECPFCGSKSVYVADKWASASGGGYWRKRVAYVRCRSCNARGPAIKTDRDYDVRNERLDKLAHSELSADAWAAWFGQFPKPKKGDIKQMELEV